jgi:putative transposon-encoded protein
MSDIFLKKDALNLLEKKHIVFFGDSSKLNIPKHAICNHKNQCVCVCHVCMYVWHVCLQVCLYLQRMFGGGGSVEITLCIMRGTYNIIK